MLVEFKFSNYRSFKDESILSMEAVGLGNLKQSLLKYKNTNILPSAAIYGKNGGGKSNVIRAFWLAVQFIRNAQRTQHEKAGIPVRPFLLDDYSSSQATSFEFTYISDDIKYVYGFSATKQRILSEFLKCAPKGKSASVFSREDQTFTFPENRDKRIKELIKGAVAPNQLFFAVACTMNFEPCIKAMKWFREGIYFSQDYSDIPEQILENSEDQNILSAMVSYAKSADVGIQDIKFEISNNPIDDIDNFPNEMPDSLKRALSDFVKAISETSVSAEASLKVGEVKATSFHKGISKNGDSQLFPLDIADESDGTRKLIAFSPAIEKALLTGGLFVVDEIERELHPILVSYIVSKFQSHHTNKNNAQLIFTTHNTELLNLDILRKDQIYFADKSRKTGISELYSASDFSTPTSENIRKGYLLGKYGATPNVEPEVVE
ncbi:MAG: ATP-binding protein [Oscillospiraceae bacterium]